jgi:hypothetical protein
MTDRAPPTTVPLAADERILHERAIPYHPEDRLPGAIPWEQGEDSKHRPLPLRWGGVRLRVVPALSARGGCMGDRRRRLSREDLEAMRQEFVVGEGAGSLDDDLHQIRRSARLGVSPEDWARARKLAPAYARALRRYLDQG